MHIIRVNKKYYAQTLLEECYSHDLSLSSCYESDNESNEGDNESNNESVNESDK